MSEERPRGPGPRHRSSLIADDVVIELNLRAYLLGLEPPMTIERARTYRYQYNDNRGKLVVVDFAKLQKDALPYLPRTRDFLRVAVDLGLIEPEPVGLFG